jgi:hypothetical protein
MPHGLRACKAAGIEPEYTPYQGNDPLAFVISKNLKRRHLSTSQRAAIAAEIAKLPQGGDRKSDQAANLPFDSVTQAQAAKMLNVSERSVRAARKRCFGFRRGAHRHPPRPRKHWRRIHRRRWWRSRRATPEAQEESEMSLGESLVLLYRKRLSPKVLPVRRLLRSAVFPSF